MFVGSCLKDQRLAFYLGDTYREYASRVPGYPGHVLRSARQMAPPGRILPYRTCGSDSTGVKTWLRETLREYGKRNMTDTDSYLSSSSPGSHFWPFFPVGGFTFR